LGASIIGCRDLARRPCGSLKVDFSKAHEILGWQPVVSVGETIRRVAEKQREKSQLNRSIKGRISDALTPVVGKLPPFFG